MTDIQTDTRIGTIEVKVKKLDAELGAFKAQMSKLRDGPGKVSQSYFPLVHAAYRIWRIVREALSVVLVYRFFSGRMGTRCQLGYLESSCHQSQACTDV